MSLEIIPIYINKEICLNDDIAKLILDNFQIHNNDIIVVTHKIISKQEGRLIKISEIVPSILSIGISTEYNKDARIVEAILSESKRIVRMHNGLLIVETNHGFICANAGIDSSNVHHDHLVLLPINPDKSASIIRNKILKYSGKKISVLISDTFGRPFRLGQTNNAIGISGINVTNDYKGRLDTFNNILMNTNIAISDELCAAAELVMGKTNYCPIAIIRNYDFMPRECKINELLRNNNDDLFI